MLCKERQKLVEDNIGLAEGIGANTHRKYRNIISLDEIRAEAVYGLVLSAKSFDFDSGVPFGAYATFRIRGQILDGLRNLKWKPRGSEEDFVFIDGFKNRDKEERNYEFVDNSDYFSSWEPDRENFLDLIASICTETEYHDFYEYYYNNKYLREIADSRNVSDSAIYQSLKSMKKKVRKYLEETKDKRGSISHELELIK